MHRSSRTLFLVLVLVLYVLVAGLYAVETPKWQAPDEPAHFNYIRTIAETGTLPVLQPGDYDQDYLDEIKSRHFPADMSVDPIRYESWQPPLYYLAAVPFYFASRAGGVDAQVLTLRMFSVLLEVIVLLIAYAVVREVFSADRLLPLATVAAIATIPMHVAVTASISNDTAAELVVALMLWLGILRLKNKVTSRRFVILGGLLFGAGLVTKSTTWVTGASVLVAAELVHWGSRYATRAEGIRTAPPSNALSEPKSEIASSQSFDSAAQPAAPLRMLLATLAPQSKAPPRGLSAGLVAPSGGVTEGRGRTAVFHLVALFGIAAVLSCPMFLRNVLTYGIMDPLVVTRHEGVVVGQPTTAEMIAQLGAQRVIQNFATITFRSFWAQFGWMGVLVDERIYLALFALTAIALMGLALYGYRVVQGRAGLDVVQRWCLGVMALLVVTAIVDYLGYNGKFFQAQGRYLFPAIIPIALFLVIGLREILAKEHARLLFALLYVLMVGLDIAALFLYIVPQLGA